MYRWDILNPIRPREVGEDSRDVVSMGESGVLVHNPLQGSKLGQPLLGSARVLVTGGTATDCLLELGPGEGLLRLDGLTNNPDVGLHWNIQLGSRVPSLGVVFW